MNIKRLQSFVNLVNRYELDTYFGKGSKVQIISFGYSTQKKCNILECKLFLSDVINGLELLDAGALDIILTDVVEAYCLDNKKTMIITSVELI